MVNGYSSQVVSMTFGITRRAASASSSASVPIGHGVAQILTSFSFFAHSQRSD
jgi:hypothetical protein